MSFIQRLEELPFLQAFFFDGIKRKPSKPKLRGERKKTTTRARCCTEHAVVRLHYITIDGYCQHKRYLYVTCVLLVQVITGILVAMLT